MKNILIIVKEQIGQFVDINLCKNTFKTVTINNLFVHDVWQHEDDAFIINIKLSAAHIIFDKPIGLNYQFFKNEEEFNPTSIEFIPNSPYISGDLNGNILIDDQIELNSFIIKAYDGDKSASAEILIEKES